MYKKPLLAAICGAAAVLVLSQPASAVQSKDFRFETTSDLASICTVPEQAAEYPVANQACRAFIEASIQYHDEVVSRKGLKRLVCYSANTTIEDGKAAFVAWAAANASNAKLMGEVPVVGLMRALNAKYPCKS